MGVIVKKPNNKNNMLNRIKFIFDGILKNRYNNLSASAKKNNNSRISPELLKEIKSIQVRTNYLVNDVMTGEYETAFKGRGMEFAEVREYQPGDDIRSIDWNVTARMGLPYIKEYKEERELTLMILVDVSSSGRFGSTDKSKTEVSAEVASILAYLAIKNNDKVGLIIYSDKIEQYIPPKKGRGHVWLVIKSILAFVHSIKEEEIRRKTDIDVPLEFLMKVHKRKTVAFLISDFIDTGFKKNLKMAKQKHDIIAIMIIDPNEKQMPKVGLIELEDAESGQTILIDSSNTEMGEKLQDLNKKSYEQLNKLFLSSKIDLIKIQTNQSYTQPILKFFKLREKRMV